MQLQGSQQEFVPQQEISDVGGLLSRESLQVCVSWCKRAGARTSAAGARTEASSKSVAVPSNSAWMAASCPAAMAGWAGRLAFHTASMKR